MVVTGAGTATTITLAAAVPSVPPSTDVTAPVVLIFVPNVVPVTFALKVHEAFDASVAPVKLTLPDPAVAVIVPPPQLPASPLGVETIRPAGNVSVKPTPVNVEALGLLMVKLSEVEPFSTTLPEPKDFPIVGGTTAAPATVTLADAVPPLPPSTEVTAPVVLLLTPAVVPVTLTLRLHEALDVSVAPLSVTVPDPAVAVNVAPQVFTSPFGVETTSPAGSVSVKPTPVNDVELLGLPTTKKRWVDPFNAMFGTSNDFAIVGGEGPAAVTA